MFFLNPLQEGEKIYDLAELYDTSAIQQLYEQIAPHKQASQ